MNMIALERSKHVNQNREMSVVKLPLSTVKLINSSQVITSVSSVIKELMENAIDAGAKNIEIKLEKHGFEKIEVRDDGCGINSSDIQYVCLPSYTSKISGFSDLENLCCYGFRGEALSSLCSVAQVSITTKTVDDDVAMCYLFNSCGQVISSKASHLLKGTTVCAVELFKGLPVRKQLMSSSRRASEELKKLENVVKSISVIHPQLRVTLTHNKFLIWQKTSVSSLRQSVTQVFTPPVVTKLHRIHYSDELMKLEMMIPKRDCDVSSLCFSSVSDSLCIFINKRAVVDKKLHKVVLDELTQYFGHYLPASKYPMCIIILTVPTNTLDVNLEPNKSKVLLQHMDEILESVKGQMRLYYYEPLLIPKINEEEQDSDTKSNKKRKVEAGSSTKTFVATKDSVFVNVLKDNVFKYSVEDAGKIEQEQNAKNILEAVVNDEVCPDVYKIGNKEDSYTSQAIEIEDSDNENLNIVRVPDNSIDSNNSLMGLALKQEKLINTGNCVASSLNVEKCDYTCNTKNNTAATLNSFSSTSKNKTVLYEDCGHDIRYVENVQVDKFGTKMNDESFTNKNVGTVILSKDDNCNEKLVNSDLVSKYLLTNQKYSATELKINDDHFVKNSEVCVSKDIGKDIQTTTISQWSRGETDPLQSFQVPSALDRSSLFKDQVNCTDSYFVECTTVDKVKNQMTSDEILSCTEDSSKLKSKELGEKFNRDFYLQDHMVESDQNIHNSGAQVANIDGEKKILQKQNESIVIEKKYIETEIDICEINPFTNSHLRKADICTVVGQLEASSLWLYCRNDEIGVTSVDRLHEAVQFQKNLESISLPVKKLESNISVRERDLGATLWNLLLSLERQDHCITDERIMKNGFVIEISDDDVDDVQATITYSALHIAYYGLDELIELLQMIQNQDQTLSLLHFRPLKVISYIRSETMRQCYYNTPSYDIETINELLLFWFMYVKPNSESCIHHKQVVLPLPM